MIPRTLKLDSIRPLSKCAQQRAQPVRDLNLKISNYVAWIIIIPMAALQALNYCKMNLKGCSLMTSEEGECESGGKYKI